jgi:peptidoglycan/LPS O-acetylase OafA/YrhL
VTPDAAPSITGHRKHVSSDRTLDGASGKHISALDGVRGLAFCMVYFQHFAGGEHIHLRILELVRGVGWTGVDLFFCLSGFLITGILYDTRHDPHYFRNFYARRALRIFPLYYLCVAMWMRSERSRSWLKHAHLVMA